MRRSRFLAVTALCWGLASAALVAQSPESRRQLSTFNQHLASIRDSSAVRGIEQDLAREEPTDSLKLLERALTLLRLTEFGNPWAARQAIGQTRQATEKHPDWPVAWHLLGRSLLTEGDRMAADPLELGRRVGFGQFEEAANALVHAAKLEPTYLPALMELQRAVTETRDTSRFSTQLLPALRSAAEAGVREPAFLLYLGRAERGFGSDERARDAFREYLAVGGNRGIGLRELAWASFAFGDTSAGSIYYDGAREDDSASVAAYRGDLSLIVSDDVLAGFDSLSGEARVAWLRQFWEDRDHEALRRPGERLAEHYRRMTHAERHYVVLANRRLDSEALYGGGIRAFASGTQFSGWDQWVERQVESNSKLAAPPEKVMQSTGEISEGTSQLLQWHADRVYDVSPHPQTGIDSSRFDQRGLLYIRQGEPDTIITTVAWGVEPNQTWWYRRPDGDLMLHFANAPEDFRFRSRLGRIRTDVSNSGEAPAGWFLLNDRCLIYPKYCKGMYWGFYGKKKLADEEERLVLASIAVATHTDAHELSFSRDLQFEAAAFAAGRAGSDGLVHLTWRYRPGTIPLAAPGTEVLLPTRVRAVLLDTLGHAVNWRDTTLTVRARAGDTTVAQVGRLGMTAPSGHYTWRVALSVGDTIGGIPPRGTVVVPPFDAGTVTISDLLIAAPREGAPWARPEGDTAYVTPRSRWFRSDPLTLYHEIYGLREGESYSSSLSLKRGKRTVLSATYTGIGSFDVTGVYRTLSLKDVSPGEYTLEIAVKGETGPWARRSRLLTVLKEK
jgi:tetratricopeptide (TPR) repeat protein